MIVSLKRTTNNENTFRFLTEKIKGGQKFEIDILNLLEQLGYSRKSKYYEEKIEELGYEGATILFLYDIVNLTPTEVNILRKPLNSETTSYIYDKIYKGERLNLLMVGLHIREYTLETVKKLYEST